MAMPDFPDATIAKIGASLFGAFVSLRFVVGTWPERLMMFVGGAALSYYASAPVSIWIGGGEETLGLIGFMLGLLSMTIVAKLYEAFQALDAKEMGKDLWAWFIRKWGA